jgi:ABC-2 type transport system permease protein
VPDFEYQPTSLSSVFQGYLLDIILLLFWAFLVVALLIFGTKKMDVL